MIGHTFRGLLTGAAIAVTAPTTLAETEFTQTTFELGDWTFFPAADTATDRVESVLAFNTSDELTGANIAVVLYERLPDNSWRRASYKGSQSKDEFVNAAKDAKPGVDALTLEQMLRDANITLTPDEDVFGVDVVHPDDFGSGVLESDPYNDVIQGSPVGMELVNYLVSVGWEAAQVDFETELPNNELLKIDVDIVLDAMASAVEIELIDKTVTTSEQADIILAAIAQASVSTCEWELEVVRTAKGWSKWKCDGNWYAVSGVFADGPPAGIFRINFQRTVYRDKWRLVTITCADCSKKNFTQFKRQESHQTGYAHFTNPDGSTNTPPASVTPNGPDEHTHPVACKPSSGASRTTDRSWAPAKPTC